MITSYDYNEKYKHFKVSISAMELEKDVGWSHKHEKSSSEKPISAIAKVKKCLATSKY